MAQGGYILPRFPPTRAAIHHGVMSLLKELQNVSLPSEERQSKESKRQFWREIFKTEKWQ